MPKTDRQKGLDNLRDVLAGSSGEELDLDAWVSVWSPESYAGDETNLAMHCHITLGSGLTAARNIMTGPHN